MKLKMFRIRQRHYLYMVLGSLCGFILLGLVSYQLVGRMMIDQSRKNAMGLSVIAAGEIDGDQFEDIHSEKDSTFQEVYDQLMKYKDYNMLEYIYTMRLVDGELQFVVDADPEDPAKCGEAYEWFEDMGSAFHGKPSCDQQLTRDKWGDFFSAYAPIYNSSNEVVGIVGCDIRTSDINTRLAELKKVILLIISVFALVSLGVLLWLSKQMVSRDVLTGILNFESLQGVARHLQRQGRLKEYSMLQVNIKDFRYLNQKVGFRGGDDILKEFAIYLKSLLYRKEYVARNGNDNFLLLLKQGREQEFLEQLSDIRVVVAAEEGEKELQIHARGGIYPIREEDDLSKAIHMCSLAVDRTRKEDAEDFVWYQDEMSQRMIEEKVVLTEYLQGIERGEFQVYYQPKVDIRNNRLCGAEALVRWFRDGKMISPGQFIPILEKEGKIIELDFYVFEQVCKDLHKWIEEGMQPVRISSNFSKLHLKNPSLSEDVMAVVQRYQVDTRYLEIELTESSGYSDFDALEQFVGDMEAAGIYTSIDDFGTGYSSLSMLKDIDVDVVKLDKSFCDNLEDQKEHGANLVGNVIRMIKDLDRTVIAEGVETQGQVDFLKETECSVVQGFHYDKPLPKEEFENRLRNPEYPDIVG